MPNYYGSGHASSPTEGELVLMRPTRAWMARLVILLVLALLGSLAWVSVATAEVDDDVPGVSQVVPFVVSGSLDATTDAHDVYSFWVNAGQTIEATMTGDVGTNFDVWIYGPGTTTVVHNDNILAYSAFIGTSSEHINFVAWDSGTYYADCFAAAGSGSYELSMHPIGAVPFHMSALTGSKSAKKGRSVKFTTTITPEYNTALWTPIEFQFEHYENHHYKRKAIKPGLDYVDTHRVKSVVSIKYKFSKKGKWRVRAKFWDPAHKTTYTKYRAITIT